MLCKKWIHWWKNSIVKFFRFVSQDIRNKNIGKMLHYMSESMRTSFETQKVHRSITSLQKVQSLQGRWFKVRVDDVEKIVTGNSVERNCIYVKDGKFYRVLSVFKSLITNGDMKEKETKTKNWKYIYKYLRLFMVIIRHI